MKTHEDVCQSWFDEPIKSLLDQYKKSYHARRKVDLAGEILCSLYKKKVWILTLDQIPGQAYESLPANWKNVFDQLGWLPATMQSQGSPPFLFGFVTQAGLEYFQNQQKESLGSLKPIEIMFSDLVGLSLLFGSLALAINPLGDTFFIFESKEIPLLYKGFLRIGDQFIRVMSPEAQSTSASSSESRDVEDLSEPRRIPLELPPPAPQDLAYLPDWNPFTEGEKKSVFKTLKKHNKLFRQCALALLQWVTEEQKPAFMRVIFLDVEDMKTLGGLDGNRILSEIRQELFTCLDQPDQAFDVLLLPYKIYEHIWKEIPKSHKSYLGGK